MSKRIQATNIGRKTEEQGFALPLVIVVGLFLMVSGFGLSHRPLVPFADQSKNNQQLQAQELAERGVTEILDQLNTDHRYLWINCYNSIGKLWSGQHWRLEQWWRIQWSNVPRRRQNPG